MPIAKLGVCFVERPMSAGLKIGVSFADRSQRLCLRTQSLEGGLQHFFLGAKNAQGELLLH